MKQRNPTRALLAAAMARCPEGKTMREYAAEIGAGYENVSKAATMMRELGEAVCVQVSRVWTWTLPEHEATMLAAAYARRDQISADKERAGVYEARRQRDREMRRERRARARAEKRGRPVKERVQNAPNARYRWPSESYWQAPQRLLSSVWDLAA